ncbi:hypothetical protein [Phormidium tenue]|uniref:hypothetical protein n=1 Tax=Phormidium tenue TaxID=126344 RepID=UPI001F54BD5D|nr:hypothetical protein [Phormidium tenue]
MKTAVNQWLFSEYDDTTVTISLWFADVQIQIADTDKFLKALLSGTFKNLSGSAMRWMAIVNFYSPAYLYL